VPPVDATSFQRGLSMSLITQVRSWS